ncbi:DNA-binding transcriptional LysR family regulator [Caulobacter ginsengisoli]|uniref:DNA-binding transcriptional LysR family regulator n=1 Tax=Caulobacter ginsengisoli TaxID=400775 RepID=A0ABU0IV63_9CAUL|nr:LysR family transcriptional regulator [Caulobacter ginsengisoli]MDQ0465889.1 DNA-binding transcriptional LysR family regulator [Caulobacter ginsengisoli]
MNVAHITSLDLNLLRVLDVLLEERNVTRAGQRLGLSQSAVSHALNRLRYALGDELLLRGAHGMTPTPRALELGPQIHSALNQLGAALSPSDFDPATTRRRFAIATGAYGCAVLVPGLVAALAQQAPGAELAITETGADLLEQLDARRVDFLISGVQFAPERFLTENLLSDEMVWVAGPLGPLADGPYTLERLVSVPHVMVERRTPFPITEATVLGLRPSYKDLGAFESALEHAGLRQRVGITVPDMYSALAVVARTEMAAMIPRRIATMSSAGGRLRLIEPPYPSPQVDATLMFLRDRLSEPAVDWMREQLHAVAAVV